MSKLSKFTDEELAQELQRRNQEKIASTTLGKPTPKSLEAVNWKGVYDNCILRIKQIDGGDFEDDMKQYIYEDAMTAVFGPNVWDWISKKRGG